MNIKREGVGQEQDHKAATDVFTTQNSGYQHSITDFQF